MEKVSVILPVFNVEKNVELSVKSVLSQTYSNLEVILVDDGSTDRSGAICDEISKTDSRITVIHQNHEGPSGSRNRGIEKASGRYIVFIDSDDYIAPEMIEILYKNLNQYDADVSMCEFKRVTEEELEKLPKQHEKSDGQNTILYDKEQLFPLLFHHSFKNKSSLIVVWNKMYRAEVFESLRFPDGRIHEDEYLIHHVLNNVNRLVYTDAVYYYYVKHKNSIMGNYSEQRIWDALYAYEDRADMFLSLNLMEFYGKSMRDWLYHAKKSCIMCRQLEVPEYSRIERKLCKEIRARLAEMRVNHSISQIKFLKEMLWTYGGYKLAK